MAFARATSDSSPIELPLFLYSEDQQEQAGAPEYGTLYHATRARHLESFDDLGVRPLLFRRANYLSPGPSFNLSDTVEQAVAHVLHGRPQPCIGGRPPDPIAVLAFKVQTALITNGPRTQYVGMVEPGTRIHKGDADWISENYDWAGKAAVDVQTDWVISPFVTPGAAGEYIAADSWTCSERLPVHVAAVSRASWAILANSLVAIFLIP
ncbi:hypothetical protein B0H16DRAFT_1894930 [Mycena metata]|uniref:Uncharacterized protein n=1 Tax=Mycena metata TaxID=1033252 RepID=A0AAD7HQG7_9AGAR|nr:hypothetical protein B0H16DRAFT_1894930 [Mycena metata]